MRSENAMGNSVEISSSWRIIDDRLLKHRTIAPLFLQSFHTHITFICLFRAVFFNLNKFKISGLHLPELKSHAQKNNIRSV